MAKKEGTFQYCSNCNLNPICCSNFNIINAPTLNRDELEKIKSFVENDKFYNKIEEELYSLKVKNDNCIFYKDNKCEIYDIRPNDCRLYPFDIIKRNDKYYLIIYCLDCFRYRDMEKEIPNIELIVNNIKPWIDNFTDERNFTKMKDKKYKIIKEIKIP